MTETVSPVFFLRRLAIGVLLVNLFIIALAGIAIHQSRLQYEERATITTRNLSQVLDEYFNGVIAKIDVALLSVVDEAEKQLARGGIDRQAINSYIIRQQARIPELYGLRMTNAKGDVAYGMDLAPGVNVADRDYFIRPSNDLKVGLFISKPVFARTTGKWVINFARRFNRPDGSFAGVVFGMITLEDFARMFSRINVGKHGAIMLFDSDLGVIARYPEPQGIGSTIGKKFTSAEIRGLFERNQTSATYRAHGTIDDIERIFSYRKIAAYPLYVQVGLAKSDYLGEWHNEIVKMLALVALFFLVVLCLAWLLYRYITEHKKLEAQLIQSQKMESVGLLAGGIAHDFNNILSGMMGYVTLLQMKSKEGDPARQYLNQLLSLTERAAALTRSLLAFSRKQILDIRPTNLNDIVGMVGKLLSRVIGEDIELNLKPSDKDVVVNADAGQIEQALMNLATNARDAMPEGGTLTVSTGPFEMDNHFINMHGYGKPGKYALLIVQDTGMGIDEETRKKIFEPFFTTKGADKGTGLGLAMVYGTIKQHDGYINVYSEEGKGTTFKIYLPAIEAEAAEEKTVDNIPRRGGTETILLVEDEASLRQATRSILQEFGYRVIEAEDGNDAVNKFAEHKAEIKLVLMDVIMPGKSGKEAYQEMQKIQPDAKVIFTSGHTGDMLTSKKIAEEGLHFISKPVSPRELFEKIRDVLDKRKD